MKITLRELFLLVLVVALALGWWLDRSRLAVQCTELRITAHDACELAGRFGWLLNNHGNYSVRFEENGIVAEPAPQHNGAAFGTSIQFAGLERIQAMVESKDFPQ